MFLRIEVQRQVSNLIIKKLHSIYVNNRFSCVKLRPKWTDFLLNCPKNHTLQLI